MAQSVLRLAKGWTVRVSNPGDGEIFCTRPVRTDPPIRLGRGVDHPPPPSAEVKERVQLYFYSLSGSSEPVLE